MNSSEIKLGNNLQTKINLNYILHITHTPSWLRKLVRNNCCWFCVIHIKHRIKFYGQNVVFLDVKPGCT